MLPLVGIEPWPSDSKSNTKVLVLQANIKLV